MKHIMLDEKDFENLTKGGVVEKNDVKIALEDIGYDNLIEILLKNADNFYNKT